jgi:hypothetical protein
VSRTANSNDILGLVDYMRAKRREGCKVCQLSGDIRAQLRTASDKKILIRDQIAWLRDVVGADITADDLTSHRSGRHDDAAA